MKIGKLSIDGETKKEELVLQTIDICAGGALLQTGGGLPLGTEISMDLILPLDRFKEIKSKKTLIEVRGKVIRNQENGVAVCFDNEYRISPVHN